MPLSKARMRERKRLERVKPKLENVKPNLDALQSDSRGIKEVLNTTVSPLVQPKYGWPVDPNESITDQVRRLYPDGTLPNCPDGRYRVQPDSVIPKQGSVIPKTDALQSNSLKKKSNTGIPLYNPSIHKAGDMVRLPSGMIAIVPKRDGEGNLIPY